MTADHISETRDIFDQGRSHRASLGFVIPATDRTSEADLLAMAPEGVGIHFSRIAMSGDITVEQLRMMEGSIEGAASLILPDEGVDALCFHCTSGSLFVGEKNVINALAAAGNAHWGTTVLTSAVEAFKVLGITRLSLVTPYLQEITSALEGYFEGLGFTIPCVKSMNLPLDSDIARVKPGHIAACATEADHPDSQAVFISCTGLRSVEIIAALEERLGKPIVTSTQAAMWHMLRTVGVHDCLEGYGRLLEVFSG
ncbi:MAG TPA: arylmalonate decarboxylase [Deltaproteobacteria bacterium]|nr:arylmalonate decarboxylase [Deltaproteobacteria bacterium]